jgi:hypothetical protein
MTISADLTIQSSCSRTPGSTFKPALQPLRFGDVNRGAIFLNGDRSSRFRPWLAVASPSGDATIERPTKIWH